MRKRQCKQCNKWDPYNICDYGKVINKFPAFGYLPGCGNDKFFIFIYIVRCTKCGRTWTYRKKKK